VKNIFQSILAQDMAKQARMVELITLAVFAFLLLVVILLWQFQISITVPGPEGQRIVVDQMNIFELLLSKK
jgi:hypothetical protein